MNSHQSIFGAAANDDKRKFFNGKFDRLIRKIDFASEKESIQPENAEKICVAFGQFLKEMRWPLAQFCFEDLLAEKCGEFEFRNDGKVPNWYHELREILPFLASVRSGQLKAEDFEPFGGLETVVAVILRHDSWEDLGNDRKVLRAQIHKRYPYMTTSEIQAIEDKLEHYLEGVDVLTKKEPLRDASGEFVRKDNGKLKKQDRFGGQTNIYYNHVLRHPHTILGKFYDGGEGMATRNEAGFNTEDNEAYTQERRMLYGARPLVEEATHNFPFLKGAVKSADAMLGILLMAQEVVNYYDSNTDQDPEYASPINIDKYLPAATQGYKHLPRAWHPLSIFLERLEDKAAKEVEPRTSVLLCRAFYPALEGHFKIPHNQHECTPRLGQNDNFPKAGLG